MNPDELRHLYVEEHQSLTDLATLFGKHRDTVRKTLVNAGVTIRTRTEAMQVCPKLGKHLIGKRRYFTPEWCRNISLAKRRQA